MEGPILGFVLGSPDFDGNPLGIKDGDSEGLELGSDDDCSDPDGSTLD